MNDFKRHITGWRGGGFTCPCCREIPSKVESRRLARRRLANEDRRARLARPDED